MQKYELMVILKPLLPDDMRNAVLKKIEKLVSGAKGSITKTDVWGKRHMAYLLKKHEEGYYVVYSFGVPKNTIDGIKKELKLTGDILRFLITKVD